MMDVQIDDDLVGAVNRGEIDEWQAMSVQSCRAATLLQDQFGEIKKKLDELTIPIPSESPPERSVIHLVSRGG